MLLDLNMDDLTGVLNYVAESDCACEVLPLPDGIKPDCVTCAARRLIGELCNQAPDETNVVTLRESTGFERELTDDDKRAIVLEHHRPGQDT